MAVHIAHRDVDLMNSMIQKQRTLNALVDELAVPVDRAAIPTQLLSAIEAGRGNMGKEIAHLLDELANNIQHFIPLLQGTNVSEHDLMNAGAPAAQAGEAMLLVQRAGGTDDALKEAITGLGISRDHVRNTFLPSPLQPLIFLCRSHRRAFWDMSLPSLVRQSPDLEATLPRSVSPWFRLETGR